MSGCGNCPQDSALPDTSLCMQMVEPSLLEHVHLQPSRSSESFTIRLHSGHEVRLSRSIISSCQSENESSILVAFRKIFAPMSS